MGTEIAVREGQELAYRHELSVEEIVAQAKKIHEVMQEAMEEKIHYGTIPGTPKPTLYKAGAEKLCLLFRFDPQPMSKSTDYPDGHRDVKSTTTLYHIPTGLRIGSGEGSCSTREAKYAWRKAERTCPTCEAPAIIKGKAQYGGGWVCFKKKGGCGAKFEDEDEAIVTQEVGRIPNPDLADQYNTVLKMANKRSLVAAVLNCTAASDVFTQDLADDDEDEPGPDEPDAERHSGSSSPGTPITEGQNRRLWAIAHGSKLNDDQIHAIIGEFGYASTKDIRVADYDDIINRLKSPPSK